MHSVFVSFNGHGYAHDYTYFNVWRLFLCATLFVPHEHRASGRRTRGRTNIYTHIQLSPIVINSTIYFSCQLDFVCAFFFSLFHRISFDQDNRIWAHTVLNGIAMNRCCINITFWIQELDIFFRIFFSCEIIAFIPLPTALLYDEWIWSFPSLHPIRALCL